VRSPGLDSSGRVGRPGECKGLVSTDGNERPLARKCLLSCSANDPGAGTREPSTEPEELTEVKSVSSVNPLRVD